MNKKYFIFAFLSALLFGFSTPLSKILLNDIEPILLASFFYLGSGVCLIPFSYKNFESEYQHLRTHKKDVARLLGASVFGGILGPVALLYGIKMINATSASLLLNLETVATTFLAWIFFKEGLTKRVVASSILTVVAGVLLVTEGNYEFNFGGLLIALGCFFWGFDNNFTATVEGVSPTSNTIIKGITSGLFNLAVGISLFGFDISLTTLLLAVVVGFFSYGVSIVLYISAARKLGASRSQIIFSLNPFLGGLLSFIIFNNVLETKFFIALGVMAIAVFLLYYEKHGHEHIHESEEHEHEHTHDDGHHDHTHENLEPKVSHTHLHKHETVKHTHTHFPDLHHRHKH